eukprot:2436191-Rhodomonas_salina.5
MPFFSSSAPTNGTRPRLLSATNGQGLVYLYTGYPGYYTGYPGTPGTCAPPPPADKSVMSVNGSYPVCHGKVEKLGDRAHSCSRSGLNSCAQQHQSGQVQSGKLYLGLSDVSESTSPDSEEGTVPRQPPALAGSPHQAADADGWRVSARGVPPKKVPPSPSRLSDLHLPALSLLPDAKALFPVVTV